MASKDSEYYRTRASKQRASAEDSTKQNVAVIHAALAKEYDALAAQPELRPELPEAYELPAAGKPSLKRRLAKPTLRNLSLVRHKWLTGSQQVLSAASPRIGPFIGRPG